ncbi:CpsB/CapC family capsule biosynthesis tyrosine phosphatase [Butyricicoccus porcorum]|uniref:protein-tyrosine-phosphatase n=1 Tax=Butyricicoccus porcorum TaxID=1945634 RepID=A0A252F3F3_9FIRM|nr:CpsB/CapC family capsule biosynthesis tyrosine phosphatase [Butyricicoccus porcorum]MCI7739003.1 capsular polysaccharide biosynthesis protein [Lachnospiraceae bacterium]OUM20296.1 capsular polysaccharide biosynthesis protein [Butyricicoccus porcorum]
MKVIDFHSHILPNIDDGSKDINMSMEMLKRSKEQQIDVMIATPHFYADSDTIEHFLKKRTYALKQLEDNIDFSAPKIVSGAEVCFFAGIGRADNIEELCIGSSDLMLLEMPFRAWSKGDLREVERLLNRGIRPIIAHLERFYRFQKDKELIQDLFAFPVLIQVNAECLLSWKDRRRAIKLFQSGQAHLLGSDCHNLTGRPQNLMEGRAMLEKKIGRQFLNQMDQLGVSLLREDI